jgi:hypothetical protein
VHFGSQPVNSIRHCFEEALFLHDLLLEGSIPTELGNFEAISKFMCTLFDFATTYLLCNIIRPRVFVEFLYLHGSKLSGPIPTEFGCLPNVGTNRLNVVLASWYSNIQDGYILTHCFPVLKSICF